MYSPAGDVTGVSLEGSCLQGELCEVPSMRVHFSWLPLIVLGVNVVPFIKGKYRKVKAPRNDVYTYGKLCTISNIKE